MIEKKEVSGQVLHLDYQEFSDQVFHRCKLVYSGGRPPVMNNVDVIECEFIFEGAALNTVHFMGTLAHSGDVDLVVHQMLGLTGWGPISGK